ncbi:bifunctional UDP-N-acetylmuramoyl-tripeptide:D-alanyl-D-alanine ligase/alanine racemase [Williamwhitmania taraxaci]|uniref:Alanine racemase n=1 Tax=Williamwhitmania taraxaci TaxID=1640674 RepID=A0A1G6JGD0_9BACT|nr:bifunctional UDP-N-acetylmuramoyl-tripeptide:D-alanyl-D-alanine ligase/alanine racemase [Williamwhitmania taraxaci]SDC17708.1 UDP-N-acetylmuramoyl-tripeptide--D-alanyl-D-alanine ligase [Williamwhitmania taraxaci]
MDATKITEIANAIGGTIYGEANPSVDYVTIDSRTINSAKGALFFAIKGTHQDGHRFIANLYEKEVRAFVVSDIPHDLAKMVGAVFIVVEDTLDALQRLAVWYRKQYHIPVIGITGSNGKTIVKEWLYQLLHDEFQVVRSPRSFNSQVGVPLSVLLLEHNAQLAIFEAGISLSGEMERLRPMIAPEIGIITNLGQAHQENFSTMEEKVREKLILFKNSKVLICSVDNDLVYNAALAATKLTGTQLFTWSEKGGEADIIVVRRSLGKGVELQVTYEKRQLQIPLPFSDAASIENSLHCIALLLYLGHGNILERGSMSNLAPVAMRMELKEAVNGSTLINDSYNSDINSLTIALDFLKNQVQHSARTLIISDILQSGKEEVALYREVSRLAVAKGVTKVIGIGPAIYKNEKLFPQPAEFFLTTEAFLASASKSDFRDEAILIKGSRDFGFERISAFLERKVHTTVLDINLNAIIHNLNHFRGLLHPGTMLMAMVKAFSYGSGSYEIASVLQFHRVNYLAVAFADEGVALREAGITMPILVLNPEAGSFATMVEHKLEPEIFNLTSLTDFAREVEHLGMQDYPIHIKLDTGMHRLGFISEHLSGLITALKSSRSILVKSVFAHLAGADEAKHDAFTLEQITIFEKNTALLRQELGYDFIRHTLNSSGIERFPQAQFDMVRLGIGLYGISALPNNPLRVVSTLKSTIVQIKDISPDESVGYGRKGRVDRPSRIATIPIGYADGLNRLLSNGVGSFLIRGHRVPIIGNICMDLCMVDITDVKAEEGDEVIIFGETPSITEMAEKLNTIPYEVLTGISRRVKRVYFQE